MSRQYACGYVLDSLLGQVTLCSRHWLPGKCSQSENKKALEVLFDAFCYFCTEPFPLVSSPYA